MMPAFSRRTCARPRAQRVRWLHCGRQGGRGHPGAGREDPRLELGPDGPADIAQESHVAHGRHTPNARAARLDDDVAEQLPKAATLVAEMPGCEQWLVHRM
jgi:hypothetical protein